MRARSVLLPALACSAVALASCGDLGSSYPGPIIRAGEVVEGVLEPNDEVYTADGSFYDLYVFKGEPDDDIEITLTSADFDAFLAGGLTPEAALRGDDDDDDGAGGTNARLRVRTDRQGRYVIRANSFRGGETGAYTLTARRADGGSYEAGKGLTALRAGQTITGRLERGDATLADESLVDLYIYRSAPGERVAFTLRSDDFDAYLTIATLNGDNLTPIASDDDSGGGTDARVVVSAPGGALAVQANSYEAGETGSYTLVAERASGVGTDVARGRYSGQWGPVEYRATQQYAPVRSLVQREQRLEATSRGLSAAYPLPQNVSLSFLECGEPNAFYSPDDDAIAFCYELISFFEQALRQQVPADRVVEAARGAYEFVILHEAGHALTHQLDLPITGREEDVADQFAALQLIRQGTQGAWAAIYGVLALQQGDMFMGSDFADEHSLGPQRLFNVACLVYGSDPMKYADLVGPQGLPEARAERCPMEYQQAEKSFDRLLGLVYGQ